MTALAKNENGQWEISTYSKENMKKTSPLLSSPKKTKGICFWNGICYNMIESLTSYTHFTPMIFIKNFFLSRFLSFRSNCLFYLLRSPLANTKEKLIFKRNARIKIA